MHISEKQEIMEPLLDQTGINNHDNLSINKSFKSPRSSFINMNQTDPAH